MRIAAIKPPQLRTTEEGSDRSASWLELFYDLVFVVAVAVLGVRLLHDTTWTGVASYVGYFVLLWWLWASHTFYADRYDTDDLVYRLLAVGQIVAIAILAASMSDGAAGSTAMFAAAYATARIVLILMYLRARRHVPETRRLVSGYLIGFGIGAAIWLLSVFVPEPFRFYLWAIGLAVEVATPYAMRRVQAKVPLDVSHLPERFGLFTILVLGESIAAVVAGLSELSWEVASTTAAILGVITATGLWWMYFDNLDGSVVRRRVEDLKAWRPTTWIYSHLPLAIALAIAGVGLEHAVVEAVAHHSFPTPERWLLVSAVAVAFAAMALNQYATVRPSAPGANLPIVRNRLTGIPVVLLFGFFAFLSSVWIVFLVTLVCAGEVAADVYVATREDGEHAVDEGQNEPDGEGAKTITPRPEPRAASFGTETSE
jgi:low temperature requirement protein LtrA